MISKIDTIVELQKKHVHKLWVKFCKLVDNNEMKEADKWLNDFHLNANHILFMMEELQREINEKKKELAEENIWID